MKNIIKDSQVTLDVLKTLQIAVVGYGNQGRAQALNLRDSGLEVVIGARYGSNTYDKAKYDGFDVCTIEQASKSSDVISVLVPDQCADQIYKERIHPNIKSGDVLLFSHGYNIVYKKICPPSSVDVVMVAPSGPGYAVRDEYKRGDGVPTLVAVNQDSSGNAKDIALAYSKAIGGTRSCCFISTFKEETETDLFGEQVVLTGVLPNIINESFKMLVDEGYDPVVSWFVTVYEVKFIAQLLSKVTIEDFYSAVSDTAEFGGLRLSDSLLDDRFKTKMKRALSDIQNGYFSDIWSREKNSEYKSLSKLREHIQKSPINSFTTRILDSLEKKK